MLWGSMNLDTVQDISLWIMRFPGKMRGLMAAGVAAVIRAIWKCRNNACFRGIYPYDPSSVITQVSLWLEYWAGLQVAAEMYSRKRGWAPLVLRIAG